MWVCILALFVDAATLHSKVSPVQKVVQLLDELKAKVEADLVAEEVMMEEYTKYCDSEANTKDDAIRSAARTLKELGSTIENAEGQISVLSAEVEKLTSKISDSEEELSEETDMRNKQRATFEKTEKEMLDTVDTLERSLVVLKRGQTQFLQGKDKKIDDLVSGLSAIVSAAWMSESDRNKLQAMLQSNDEDLTLTPQASVAAFESKGGGIVDMLDDLKDKADEALSKARKQEMVSGHEFALLQQGLEKEIADMKSRLQDAMQTRTSEEETLHSATAEEGSTKKAKAADEAYLKDLTFTCKTKAAEWEQRKMSSSEETAAIEKAKEILGGVKVFLQVGGRSADDASRRKQLVKVITGLVQRSHSFQFSQLLSDAREDPFSNVKGMIGEMIDRLMKEAAEESDAKAFCDTEQAKGKAKQAKLTESVDMSAVRIEKAVAETAKLEGHMKELQAEIAAIDASQKEATAMRQKENAAYVKARDEYQQSADAVANAISVLQTYYAQGSFVQQPEFGGSKSDIGTTIIEMLEVAESDFAKLLAEANAEETTAKEEYEDLTQKNALSKTAKTEEMSGKKSTVKSLELNLLNYKEDHASTSKELDAVLDYLDKLKPQCETKVMSYEERVQKREQEIAGLKEALTILSA
jgi:hypothetical protein